MSGTLADVDGDGCGGVAVVVKGDRAVDAGDPENNCGFNISNAGVCDDCIDRGVHFGCTMRKE